MAGLGKAVALETDKRIKRTIQKANQRYRRRHRRKDATSSTSITVFTVHVTRSQSFQTSRLLQHANADQINAVSELVLNLLKNKIPVTPPSWPNFDPIKRCYATWDVVDIR